MSDVLRSNPAFDEVLLGLSRTVKGEMRPEEVAVHALDGVNFSSMEDATRAVHAVSAVVHILRHGPVRARPVLVHG